MSAQSQGAAAVGGRGPDRGGVPAGLRVGGAFLGVALVALLLLVIDVLTRGVGTPFEFTPRVLTILLAGASLLQGYTGMIYGGPDWIRDIHRGLAEQLRRQGMNNIAEAVGCRKAWLAA